FISKIMKSYIQNFGRPDIIHAHSALWGGEIALYISKVLKIPYVITEHSSIYARDLVKSWQEPYLRRIFENASLVIGVSSRLLEDISKYFNHKNFDSVLNVVDTDYFTLPTVKRKKDPFKFLSIALLSPKKGMDILIRAFYEAFRDVDDVVLEIGGDGPSRPILESLVKELKMEEKIKFLGMLDRYQVRENMWRANVFVLPSYYETFGVVLIEAMATGLPVIATRCGGPEDFVNPKEGSFVEKRECFRVS
ncbi:MAG: glycosyltransferase, partial [Nitrososphaerales archaeon]